MKWFKGFLILLVGILLGGIGVYFADTKYDYWGIVAHNKSVTQDVKAKPIENISQIPTNQGNNDNTSKLQYRASFNDKVPILMYHHIKDNTQPYNLVEKGLDVAPEMFEKQIEILSRLGYQAITMSQLQKDLEAGNVNTRRVVLTFDDGYDDIYTNAFPILKKYNMVGTIYLITDDIGNNNYMTIEQIKELKNAGFEIGSHTLSHPNLATASVANVRLQAENSKKFLENTFGVRIYSFCYPSGKYSDEVVSEIESAGYTNAVTTNEGYVDDKSDLFTLNRIRISGTGKLSNFIDKIFMD